MKLSLLVAPVASLLMLFAGPALAHGGAPHVMGTVKSVEQQVLIVETTDHREVAVKLTAQTTYEKGESAAKQQDVTPGERVVVHTRRDGHSLTAVEVHLAAGTPSGLDGGTAR